MCVDRVIWQHLRKQYHISNFWKHPSLYQPSITTHPTSVFIDWFCCFLYLVKLIFTHMSPFESGCFSSSLFWFNSLIFYVQCFKIPYISQNIPYCIYLLFMDIWIISIRAILNKVTINIIVRILLSVHYSWEWNCR